MVVVRHNGNRMLSRAFDTEAEAHVCRTLANRYRLRLPDISGTPHASHGVLGF